MTKYQKDLVGGIVVAIAIALPLVAATVSIAITAAR